MGFLSSAGSMVAAGASVAKSVFKVGTGVLSGAWKLGTSKIGMFVMGTGAATILSSNKLGLGSKTNSLFSKFTDCIGTCIKTAVAKGAMIAGKMGISMKPVTNGIEDALTGSVSDRDAASAEAEESTGTEIKDTQAEASGDAPERQDDEQYC